MKGKWCDLFVLGLVQCAAELNLSHMLRSVDSHLGTLFRYGQLKRERHEELCRQIALLLLFAQKIRQLKLSGMEFAYLKAIAFTGADLPLRSPHHPPQLGWFRTVLTPPTYSSLPFFNLFPPRLSNSPTSSSELAGLPGTV